MRAARTRRDRPGGDRAARALVAGEVAGRGLDVDARPARGRAGRRSRRASRRDGRPAAVARRSTVTSTEAGREPGGRRAGRTISASIASLAIPRGVRRVGREQPPEVAEPGGAQERVATAWSTTSPSEWPARRGAPSISMPPRRRPVPGPNGCVSWPKPTRTPDGHERLFDPAQVVGQRHLEVRGFAGDRMDGDSTGLEQGGLVGELARAVRRERRPRVEQEPAPRALRRLGRRAAPTRSTVPRTTPVPHPLERLGDGQDRERRAVARDRVGDGLHERGRDQRARAVVDEDRRGPRPAGSRASSQRTPAATDCLAGRAARHDGRHAGREPRCCAPARRTRSGAATRTSRSTRGLPRSASSV